MSLLQLRPIQCLALVLATSLPILACTGSDTPAGGSPEPGAEPAGGHTHTAPHGGALVELGDEFAHVEVVVDTATGTLTLYVLDREAERGVAIRSAGLHVDGEASGVEAGATRAVSIHLMGVANPLTGETADSTSEFSGQAEGLRGATRLTGMLHEITVRGRTFTHVSFRYPD